ncbi:MAG: 16S rRNA (guanine(527)-N(7))-methyltransferase RsmG [bacterium]|nr:16S rRNA (guanine(527)-N(7))-methyltransferase RsmG [bacterium]
MDDPWNLLIESAAPWGLALGPETVDRMRRFAALLLEANATHNLTRITDPRELVIKHFLDSLSVALALPEDLRAGSRFLDLGSGPGFPGIPLAIALPGLSGVSLEATGKKVAFQQAAIAELALPLTALQGRAEELGRQPSHRERFDWAVARALAALPTLVEYALPFVRPGGVFIALKGARAGEEVEQATPAVRKLGGRLDRVVDLELPGGEGERHLVVIRKMSPTPAAYPRAGSAARERPLLR